MFCEKCGCRISDEAAFCNNCGTRVNSGVSMINSTPNVMPNAYNTHTKNLSGSSLISSIAAFTGLDALKYLITVGAMFLSSVIMMFFLDFDVEALGISVSARSRGAGFYVVTALFCLSASVFAALPIFMKKKATKLNFLPAKIVFIAAFVIIVIYHIGLISEADNYGGLASVKMNFAGWMFYVLSAVSIVMSFILTHNMAKGMPMEGYMRNNYDSGVMSCNPNPNINNSSAPNPVSYVSPAHIPTPQTDNSFAQPVQQYQVHQNPNVYEPKSEKNESKSSSNEYFNTPDNLI